MFDTLVAVPQFALHNEQWRPSTVSRTYSNTCCRSDVAAADDLTEGDEDAIETDELSPGALAMLVATVIPCFVRRL